MLIPGRPHLARGPIDTPTCSFFHYLLLFLAKANFPNINALKEEARQAGHFCTLNWQGGKLGMGGKEKPRYFGFWSGMRNPEDVGCGKSSTNRKLNPTAQNHNCSNFLNQVPSRLILEANQLRVTRQ